VKPAHVLGLAAGAALLAFAATVLLTRPAPPPPGVSPEVARWVGQLTARPGWLRRTASGLAGRVHPQGPQRLPGFLQVEPVERRNLEAAHHLLNLGSALGPALPQLVEAFADPRPTIRFYAFMALTYSGAPAATVVARLRAREPAGRWDVGFYASLLATEDEQVRDFAWACLEAAGPDTPAVRARLEELASEGDPVLGQRARRLLERSTASRGTSN
jgi:hypothetical protein